MAKTRNPIDGILTPENLEPQEIELDLDAEESGAKTTIVDGLTVIENPDGTVEVGEATEQELVTVDPNDHNANLAEVIPESTLNTIGRELLDGLAADEESRKAHMQTCLRGIDLLGLSIEDRTYPFKGACGVHDSKLMDAVVRAQAQLAGELLPAEGPVKNTVYGDTNDALDQRATRATSWFNYYLVDVFEDYYEDTDQMLFWLTLVGSTFKKVYMEPLKNMPVSYFILPDQFVVNFATSSLASTARMCHLIKMTEREIKQYQIKGIFRDIDLPPPDEEAADSDERKAVNYHIGLDSTQKILGDDRYTIAEFHVDYDMPGFEHKDENDKITGLPLPWIVSVDRNSGQVMQVKRNWKEGDPDHNKCEFFIHYKLLPGLGFYGMGYAHVLGSRTDARTKILRQYVDSGTFANFPAGIRVKGMRIENPNIPMAPGEWKEVDTAGLPIQQAAMPMPYKEPGDSTFKAYQDIGQGMDRIIGSVDLAIGEGRQDAPVGTTVAMLEAALKPQSGSMKRLHKSFKKEYKLIKALFKDNLVQTFAFHYLGKNIQVQPEDFGDEVAIIPVSDPNIASDAQRMLKAESIMRTAQSLAPGLPPWQREAAKHMFVKFGVDNPDKFLPPLPQDAQPLDPLTENMNALNSMPLRAGPMQDDWAHIQVHQLAMDAPGMAAHISEHIANKMRKDIENIIGISLPVGQPLPPDIENEIARQVAKAAEELQKTMQPGEDGQIDPMHVALKEIQAKIFETMSKERIAQMKSQVELTKARIKSDDAAGSRANTLRIAKMKAIAQFQTDDSTAGQSIPPEMR